jgi:hypothetical protein
LQELFDKQLRKVYISGVMSLSHLRTLPSVDDWVLLPTKPTPEEVREVNRVQGRFVRHILFDIGGGLFRNLSPENLQIVRDYCRLQYESYIFKCQKEGRIPMRYRHTGRGYIAWWKWQQKSLYVQYDIPRNRRQHEEAA